MKGNSTAFALAALALLAPASSAHGQATTASDEMRVAQFFVGTWSCAHTVGDFSGTYTTKITNSLDNRWLEQTYDFPATSERAPVHAEYFIGYDPRNDRWIRFGAMSDGLYFAMTAKRSGNTWPWTYVLPGTNGSAVYTKNSDSQYTVDGPTYMENGKQVTEHHTCTKTS